METRWYQDEAEESIFTYFGKHTGNPVLALPTASGKGVIIAKLLKRIFTHWPNQRVIIATHVKELIQQNYDKLMMIWPEAPAGIYSAGLNSRNFISPILFGGIQSMVKNPEQFGHRDLLIIDEAHLVGHKDDTNYLKFITALKRINPNLKIIGFSATCWRMGRGLISDGPVFTDICYDLTNYNAFDRLIKEGYLCTLIPKRTGIELNVSDVKITAGEYNLADLAKAVDKDAITYAACKEAVNEGAERVSWLAFASSIKHAEHIAGCLQSFGIDAAVVHSKMPNEQRDKTLERFKNLDLKCVVNYGVLTTGFDHPALDFIIMLRPTASSGLWVQMLGRGMRPCIATKKENCLVLDFAGNTKRLGPINDPVIPKKKGQKAGVAPVRICDQCGCYNHARATVCIACGAAFAILPKITKVADTAALIKKPYEPKVEEFAVGNVLYNRHVKPGYPPMIKVDYWCGLRMFSEYVCFEHGGFAANQARDWWKRRFPSFGVPKTTDEAAMYIAHAPPPKKLLVDTGKHYPQIIATIF